MLGGVLGMAWGAGGLHSSVHDPEWLRVMNICLALLLIPTGALLLYGWIWLFLVVLGLTVGIHRGVNLSLTKTAKG